MKSNRETYRGTVKRGWRCITMHPVRILCFAAGLLSAGLIPVIGPARAADKYWDVSDTASTDFELGGSGGNWVTTAGGSTYTTTPANNFTDYVYFGTRSSGVLNPSLTMSRSIGRFYFSAGGWTLGSSVDGGGNPLLAST